MSAKKTAKLSYNQQRLLEVLPQQIAELESELEKIKTELADSSLYTENPDKFNELTSKYEEITSSIEQKENEWLEIQIIKENLEA